MATHTYWALSVWSLDLVGGFCSGQHVLCEGRRWVLKPPDAGRWLMLQLFLYLLGQPELHGVFMAAGICNLSSWAVIGLDDPCMSTVLSLQGVL